MADEIGGVGEPEPQKPAETQAEPESTPTPNPAQTSGESDEPEWARKLSAKLDAVLATKAEREPEPDPALVSAPLVVEQPPLPAVEVKKAQKKSKSVPVRRSPWARKKS